PTTPGDVSIVLLRGPSTNVLPIGCIVDNIPNSGKFVWTPSTSLTPDVTHYGIQIIVKGTGQYQYSTQFGISNPGFTSSKPSKDYTSSATPVSQISDGQVQAPTAAPTFTPVTSAVTNGTTSIPINTTAGANSSFIVIATTQMTLQPSSGGHPSSIIRPTKNMTVPASLKTPKPTLVVPSASATFTTSGVGTGSPIASPSASPSSGAGSIISGGMLAGLGAMAALVM
ncbi:MAG: hypothetical protein Q9190_004068, partial [Brigantiaea leucoxantha]